MRQVHRARWLVAGVAGIALAAPASGGCEAVLGLGSLEGGGGSAGRAASTTGAAGAGMGGTAGSAGKAASSSIATSATSTSTGGAAGHGGAAGATTAATAASTTSTGGAAGHGGAASATTASTAASTSATTGGGAGAAGAGGQDGGPPPLGPSCVSAPMCQGLSCCTSYLVPGGTFPMGRSVSGADQCPGGSLDGTVCGNGVGDDQPEHNVAVASYYLDAFEVTVSRFLPFVQQFNGTPPLPGAGAHPLIPGSGWDPSWNASLPQSQNALTAELTNCGHSTWNDGNLASDINCVDWYSAFAFCAWDGGYLPTEAEWEYAAAGGADNQMYPWGPTDPAMTTSLADDIYASFKSPYESIGSHPTGNGKWGHLDLAGVASEWVLDWYDPNWYAEADGGSACNNCANLNVATYKVIRGGDWGSSAVALRAAGRATYLPAGGDGVTVRCARPAL